MVLEQIYTKEAITKIFFYDFVLGVCYSVVGMAFALLLFPGDPAIVAVAITAILLLPSVRLLISEEETSEADSFDFRTWIILKKNSRILRFYAFSFLGVLCTFAFFSTMLPSLASNHLFRTQIEVLGPSGEAMFGSSAVRLFKDLLFNNLSVLAFCFLSALLIGDGAVFILMWNASVWGTVFGVLAKSAALNVNKSPVIYLMLVLIIVFPHMILEVVGYFAAAVSGGVLSRGIEKEGIKSLSFVRLLKPVLILFFIALVILILGGIVETYVLISSDTYRTIIIQSFS